MPNYRRLVVPGLPHHVTQRGVRRQQTFFSSTDFRQYLSLAENLIDNVNLEIWAYCLMPNHIHAVVVPGDKDDLARFFGPLHNQYAKLTNLKNEWQGHLWQGRYRSVAMDETHTLAALRYVELNPVRSGLCRKPEEWPWSSARGNLGLSSDPILSTKVNNKLVSNWADFLSTPEDLAEIDSLRRKTSIGRPAGDEKFIQNLESKTGRQIQPRRAGRRKKLRVKEIR